MNIEYKLHGKKSVDGNKAVRVFEQLYDCGVFPGRFSCGFNCSNSEGWFEICPDKISVVFNISFKSFNEFSKFFERMKKSEQFEFTEKFYKISDIYKHMLEECKRNEGF